MQRIFVFLYGAVAYLLFLATFLYVIGFLGNFGVPKAIDTGVPTDIWSSVAVNCVLLSLFAVQHTIMARPAFKAWWTTIIPKAIERSTFVLATCAVLGLMYWQWRPLPEAVWEVTSPAGRAVMWSLYALGFGIVLLSTFLINHFDLFGLRQVWLHLRERKPTPVAFRMTSLYRLVRHPLMLGFLIAFWATPYMSMGHLLFSLMTTGYILAGIQFEERDLVKIHGDDYLAYRNRVPMLLPYRGPAESESPAVKRQPA